MPMSEALQHRQANPYTQLLLEAARLRVGSIRTRILALGTFCAVAEVELELNRVGKAQISLQRIRRAVEEIEHHLQDGQHVPPEATGELQALFDKAKGRIEKLAKSVNERGAFADAARAALTAGAVVTAESGSGPGRAGRRRPATPLPR
jgi:hypothetical protein